MTARSAESERKADLGEEAAEMGKGTVMQAKCEARSILFGEDLAHITHCREDKVQSPAIRKQTAERKNSPQPLSTLSRGNTVRHAASVERANNHP